MIRSETQEQRRVLIALGGLAGLVVLVWAGILLFGRPMSESILAGEGPFGYLRSRGLRLVGDYPQAQQAAELLALIKTYLGRLTFVYVLCQSLLLFSSQRYPHLFRDYFAAKTHPINLAIFRICFFVTLYSRPSIRTILGLLELPESSRVAPPGLSWWVSSLPESPDLNIWLYRCFLAACVCGAIGLWTRFACASACVLTFYLMGIPQFFGKIDHHHHLVWISCLLAVSRCGDALSVDSWWQARKGIRHEVPARAYALPLRFVWLFLGIIYFFPGLWKFVISGPDWFFSQNLECRMLLRQFVGEGWTLPFPVYEYSLLCTIGSIFAVVMEIGFIFFMFLPRFRYVAAVSGFSFHWLVKLFLNISFWPIQIYYVSFIDWVGCWNWLMVKVGGKDQPAKRNSFGSKGSTSTAETDGELGKNLRWVFAVGLFFVLSNTITGFVMFDSWPLGVYPTFARIIGPTFHSISFQPIDESGQGLAEVHALFDPTIRQAYGVSIGRMGEILATASRPHAKRPDRMRDFWGHWKEKHPELPALRSVHFYLVEYSTKPGDGKQPISKTLIESIQP